MLSAHDSRAAPLLCPLPPSLLCSPSAAYTWLQPTSSTGAAQNCSILPFLIPRLCFPDGFSNGKSTKCCSVCTALQPFQPCCSTSHNPVQGYSLGKAQPREICSQQIAPGEHSCSDVSEVISLSFPNLEHAIWFCILLFKGGTHKRFCNNQELLVSFTTFALRKGFLFCLHQCDSHCVL